MSRCRRAAAFFGTEPVIDYANKAVRLSSAGPVGQPVGGSLTMANGGRLSAATGQGIALGGDLTVPVISAVELFGTPVSVEATGSMLVTTAAGAGVNGDLVNSGTVTVQGGTLASNTLQNNAGATLTVFGDLSGAITNDGDAVYEADTQVVGDYVNNGTTTVQNGVLTIIGSLTNNGTIIGDIAGGGGALGLSVLGDFAVDAAAELLMPGDTQHVKVDGNVDIAVNDNSRLDLAVAEVRMIGLGTHVQDLEVLSEDIGPDPAGLDRSLPGHYPIGTLRIGPTPTTVQLVDNRDNDNLGQSRCEAIYTSQLVIDAGATLNTNGCKIYYSALTLNGSVDDPTNLIEITFCVASSTPVAQRIGVDVSTENRYLSFTAGDVGQIQAVRVTFQALPGPHAVLDGTRMWVQAPIDVCENSGQESPPCEGATFKAAKLGCTPHFMDWSAVGTVHVSHRGIVPSGVYHIQVLNELCALDREEGFSPPLVLTQASWGDVAGPFDTSAGEWTAPDGGVDVTVDILAVLDKFRNLPTGPIKARVDLEPSEPDRKINITDVTRNIDAFRGFDYPFPPGPAPCG